MSLDSNVFALARLRRRTVLLDRDGLQSLQDGTGSARFLDRIRGRGGDPRARAEGLAASLSIADWPDAPEVAGLESHLGAAPRYLSVGHSGLDERGIGAFAGLPDSRRAVFLHDTIPLDRPDTQNTGGEKRFRDRLAWVARAATHVFAPLVPTAGDVTRHLETMGWSGEVRVAPPGVRLADPTDPGDRFPTDRPYFVVLGTIEPRKNHALLLDLWDTSPDPKPRLFVIGRRGWKIDELLPRLEAAKARGDVIEANDVDDGAVVSLLMGARALLFPSLAEGFGYPPLEAAALGTPVIATPLPQTKALLGQSAVYAPADDLYQWARAMQELEDENRPAEQAADLPKWFVHFDLVLKALG